MGTDHNKKFGLAVDYLKFLGTQDITPTQKQQEFYKLGCSFAVSCNSDKIEIVLSGLSDNFKPSIILLEQILLNSVADEEALIDLKQNILKSRDDAKLNKQTILWKIRYWHLYAIS